MERRVAFERVDNCRDLGGISTEDDRRIRRGALFRCATPGHATRADIDRIRTELSVSTWIDMRSRKEALVKCEVQNVLADSYLLVDLNSTTDLQHLSPSSPTRYHVDLNRSMKRKLHSIFWSSSNAIERFLLLIGLLFCQKWLLLRLYIAFLNRIKLRGLYVLMMEHCKLQISASLHAVARSPGPVLVNCLLGKDRTGVLVALLLSALGVPLPSILDDYAATSLLLDKKVRLQAIIVTGADEHFADAPPAELESALQQIADRYGSITAYLDDIGFTKQDRALLAQKFLEH